MERRYIFLILAVLIGAGVLFAGCTAPNPAPVTPTPVLTVTTEITTAPVTTVTTVAPLTTEKTTVPVTTVTTVKTVAPATPAAGMNIIETLEADGRFTTLVSLLEASELDANLSAPGPFTVFAPTDTAFTKLPGGTIDAFLKDPQAYYLKKLLLYHVVNKKLMTADMMRVGSIDTAIGKSIQIDVSSGTIFVNGGTKVITPDIVCSNGVIQVTDGVLSPPT